MPRHNRTYRISDEAFKRIAKLSKRSHVSGAKLLEYLVFDISEGEQTIREDSQRYDYHKTRAQVLAYINQKPFDFFAPSGLCRAHPIGRIQRL